MKEEGGREGGTGELQFWLNGEQEPISHKPSFLPPSLPPSLPSSLSPHFRHTGHCNTNAGALNQITSTLNRDIFYNPSLPPSLPPFLPPSFLTYFRHIGHRSTNAGELKQITSTLSLESPKNAVFCCARS